MKFHQSLHRLNYGNFPPEKLIWTTDRALTRYEPSDHGACTIFLQSKDLFCPCAFPKEKSLLEGFCGLWVCVFLNCSIVISHMLKMKQVSYNLYAPETSIVIKEHMCVFLFGILVLGIWLIADLYCYWCSRRMTPHVTIFLHRTSLAKLIK